MTDHAKPRIAVVGCGHGELDKIYADLDSQCAARGWLIGEIDLLLICGDFQAVRNEHDLNCMSVPRRYRRLGDFHRYYASSEMEPPAAPALTIVIGGNHEASNYLFELRHGGWLAPNIYYLGAAGVVRYGPWRIAGLSGIYSPDDYGRPHCERLPYDRDMIKSIYHVRDYDVAKMQRLSGRVDVCMSHDWPQWVELFGDYEGLYAAKPHFLDSAKRDGLGSRPAKEVLGRLRPSYWFSGHMHARFPATIKHQQGDINSAIRALPVSDDFKTDLPIFRQEKGKPKQKEREPSSTQFLALSKVGPDVPSYLEILDLELPCPDDGTLSYPGEEDGWYSLCYDEEWLAITRAYNDSLRLPDKETLVVPPEPPQAKNSKLPSLEKHVAWVKENIVDKDLLRIPRNFVPHAPTQSSLSQEGGESGKWDQPPEYANQQTADFCALLQMTNKFAESRDDVPEDDLVEFGYD